ncbi:PAS domain-containing hybrid sensor histidine kinase/response regulator [Gemmatimonas groenlandica]|uniref:PAS domain-containing hybrid sensor histidine kinase/response regulator n=1 Tax=Gemmatimonas groenlandica TaxID=2732249 RepID=UPI003CCDCA7D
MEWSPNPKLVLDREFRVRYINHAALAYGQVERDALIGRNVWECYPALKDSIFHEAYESVLTTGVTARFERYDDEHDRWQSVYAFPADDGVIAVLEDITERRRAERSLQASEAALARAQEVAGIGSFSVERPGHLQLSAQAYRLLGLDPTVDTIDIPTIRAMLASSDPERWAALSARTPIGDDISMDFTATRRDGSTVILHVLARVMKGASGEQKLFGTAQNVTEQRHALENLRRSEETLRLAQEAANIGSFDFDLRTNSMFRSDQLLRMLGLEPNDEARAHIDARPRFDFVHPDDRALVQETWSKVISTGERHVIRMRVFRVDGVERHMISSAMLVRDGNGEPARIVGTQVDITDQVRGDEERARVESQLQQAQKLESLGVLAGGIAHDFNNLLVGILGNASLALLDLEPGAEARQSIAEIEQSAQRAAELTRQLLAYAGKGRYVVETADASSVISEMTSLMRTAISRNASLQMDLATSLPRVDVDVNQFRQVVMNLITNASDALGSKPGLISVRTGRQEVSREYLSGCAPGSGAQPGSFTYVEVHDNGTGMDDATRQRIFEPFFSTKFTGRGLGLAATMGIMRSHHGAIRVYSEVGSGTSVKLLFPSSTQSSGAGTVSGARTDEWRGGGQILVVDDEDSVRAVASALLRRRGFRTQEASDGVKALELFQEQPDAFDLVLLDLTMPNMNGEETLRALRDLRPAVNVLLMSGYNEQDVTRMFAGRSLSGFLQKPFRAEELYASVARSLGVNTNGR